MKVYNPTAIGVSAGFGVPTGGTSGQILQKVDSTNYNTQWVNGTKITKILNNVSYTSVSAWNATYTASGGKVLIQAFATGFAVSTGNKAISLMRNGTAITTNNFFFNNINVHHTLPTLNYVGTNETGTNSYSVFFDGFSADGQDYATIIITEYF